MKPVVAGCRFDLTQTMSLVKAWVSGEQQLQAEADKQDRAAQEHFLSFYSLLLQIRIKLLDDKRLLTRLLTNGL